MYVDGVEVVEVWYDYEFFYVLVMLQFAVGWYPIVLEMYEKKGGVFVCFEWEGFGFKWQVVVLNVLGAELSFSDVLLSSILQVTGSFVMEGEQLQVIFKLSELCQVKFEFWLLVDEEMEMMDMEEMMFFEFFLIVQFLGFFNVFMWIGGDFMEGLVVVVIKFMDFDGEMYIYEIMVKNQICFLFILQWIICWVTGVLVQSWCSRSTVFLWWVF